MTRTGAEAESQTAAGARLLLLAQHRPLFDNRRMHLYLKFDAIVRRFAEQNIRYAVAGALALGMHGLARATEDMDMRSRAERQPYAGITVSVISKGDLVAMKRRRGSKQDEADIERMEKGDEAS